VHGDGEQTRDFTYVANVVEANRLAGFGPAEQVTGWAVNCGAGERTSLNELLSLVEGVSGRPVRREHAPPRPGDVRDSLASLERAGRVLGYRPLVDLRDGLARTWEWFEGR
jgi:nucleoside-diphosphate-sugar epimerase